LYAGRPDATRLTKAETAFTAKSVFSGFSVDDIEKAEALHSGVLGLFVEDGGMGMRRDPDNGWFKYPAENVLSVPQEDETARYCPLRFFLKRKEACRNSEATIVSYMNRRAAAPQRRFEP
jgi:hypothetical protein